MSCYDILARAHYAVRACLCVPEILGQKTKERCLQQAYVCIVSDAFYVDHEQKVYVNVNENVLAYIIIFLFCSDQPLFFFKIVIFFIFWL